MFKNKVKIFTTFCYLVLLSCSCEHNYIKDYKISFHKSSDKNFFAFVVYNKIGNESMVSSTNKIVESEIQLLRKVLKKKKYCLDGNNNPLFVITSKQEKIFDATFSNTVAQNYNIKNIVPKTYFGECI